MNNRKLLNSKKISTAHDISEEKPTTEDVSEKKSLIFLCMEVTETKYCNFHIVCASG